MVGEKAIPKGYKQTEMGVVPEEWEAPTIGDLVKQVIGGGTPSRNNSEYWNGTVPWVSVKDIATFNPSVTQEYITENGLNNSASHLIKAGTLIISTRMAVGKPIVYNVDVAINQDMKAIEWNAKVYTLFSYFFFIFNQELISSSSGGSTVKGLALPDLKKIMFPLPPLPEQKAIAEVLSDTDALIESLEALIVKKRAVKQGSMQELLTGRRRLPGFAGSGRYRQTEVGVVPEEWEVINLATSSTLKARIGWQGLTTNEYLDSGEYILITGTDFHKGLIDWQHCHFVSKERYDQDRNIQILNGDILITKDGTIGKVAYVESLPGPGTLNSGVFVIRPKDNSYYSKYVNFIFKSKYFNHFLNRLKAGSTIAHLYQKDFVGFNFPLPPLPEQKAIADVLSDMDAEIETLEHKQDKYKKIKQGMMDQLLTGKVRLV